MDLFRDARSKVRSLKLSEISKAAINNKLNYYIFPCNYITALNNTDSGLKSANAIRNRFYQWEALLPGNETIFLNWEGATQLAQDDTYMKNHWTVKYDMEKAVAYHTYIVDNSGSTEFGASDWGTFGEFASTYQENTIRVQMTSAVDLKMLTQFWLCPNPNSLNNGFDDNQIYRISGFQNYMDNLGNFTYADITLSSINNELSQSGQSIQQKIKFASPGQGFAFPKLTFDDRGVINGYTYNENLAIDYGVKQIQLEVVGNAAIYGVEVYGYPIEDNTTKENGIYAPRKLLVQDFRLPIQEDFLVVSSTRNVPYYTDIKLVGTTGFDDWQQRRKEIVGDKQMTYQGLIETTNKETINTNASLGTINDVGLMVKDEFLKLIGNDGVLPVQASNWFYDGKDASGNEGLGKKTIDLKNMVRKRYTDLFNLMSFALNYINLLPFETNYKIGWSLRDFYIIGGFLNKILFGFPFAWRTIYRNTNNLYPKLLTLPAIVNKDFYDFFTSTSFASNLNPETSTTKKIPLDVFQQAESSTLGAIFGNDSTTTALAFTITDKISTDRINTTTKATDQVPCSTVMLNQEYKDGDTTYKFKVSENTYELDANVDVGPLTDIVGSDAYVITGIGLRMLGDGDVRITMYNSDIDTITEDANVDVRDLIVFQSIVKSQAGYRNSQIREWLTFIKMSWIEAMVQWDRPFTWPKPYPLPGPETEDLERIRALMPYEGMINTETANWGNEVQGWFEDKRVFIYDFADLGFTTPQEVRDNYLSANIPNKLLLYVAQLNYLQGNGMKNTRENQFIQFPLVNIGDTVPTADKMMMDTALAVWDGAIAFSYNWIYWQPYFEGTRLMLLVKNRYRLKSYSKDSGETKTIIPSVETWFSGGYAVIIPRSTEAKTIKAKMEIKEKK